MLAAVEEWFFVALAPGVIVLWFLVLGLMSFAGGWNRLAQVYRDELTEIGDGQTWRMQSVSLRGWCGYNNCVTVEATEKGLKVSVWFIIRPGHPPLFLPYDGMTSKSRKVLGVPLAQVRMQQVPGISLDFREKLVDNIQAEFGDVWPDDSAAETSARTGAAETAVQAGGSEASAQTGDETS